MLLLTLKINDEVFRELHLEYLESIKKLTMIDSSIFLYFKTDYNGGQFSLPPSTTLLRDALNSKVNVANEKYF